MSLSRVSWYLLQTLHKKGKINTYGLEYRKAYRCTCKFKLKLFTGIFKSLQVYTLNKPYCMVIHLQSLLPFSQ